MRYFTFECLLENSANNGITTKLKLRRRIIVALLEYWTMALKAFLDCDTGHLEAHPRLYGVSSIIDALQEAFAIYFLVPKSKSWQWDRRLTVFTFFIYLNYFIPIDYIWASGLKFTWPRPRSISKWRKSNFSDLDVYFQFCPTSNLKHRHDGILLVDVYYYHC